ncbi:hypothetical protein GGI04_000036 [Coemansia thaxteri]|uniref:DOMON domain-containing protein n=1 Tax=Coemansia thaxteri TaxID=2663907 RepID=A0A9W8EH17_9FUNG|nr:hypothetical protein H4R26_000963 [Coemansia thaxteri]KAJ2009937.1 hypothetical protein GGI04_000036 [Coemansia thaxteri]KAJ2474277.1 hypothetical protein GGI02_000170 [Coemansia sp. RSA 2322]KAJ2481657.1 hypothetical protein EV174_003409 [Coemansia sp. RSA 2320]
MPALYTLVRFAGLLLLMLPCLLVSAAAADDGSQPPIINPLGITFDYKLAWVDVQSSTFGVSMQANAHSSFVNGTKWSLLIRYDPSAQANIVQITNGWGLGIYDYSSWALLPSKNPLDIMYFTVRSSGQMNLEDTVVKLAEPSTFFLVPSSTPSLASSGYELKKNQDYTINQGVNLSQIPKSAFGAWLSLSSVPAEALMTFASSPAAPTATVTTSGDLNVIKTGDDPLSHPSSTPTPSATTVLSSTPSSTSSGSGSNNGGDDASSTVLPPVKYVKGDPNYDLAANPIGTDLAGPRTGLYVVTTILSIGVIAHALGTFRRWQYKRDYRLSVLRSKAGPSLA